MPRPPVGRRTGDNPGALLFSNAQAPLKKHFTLAIPPVPPETFNAIASRIATSQPWLGQKSLVDKAQQRAQNLHEKLAGAQELLKDLEDQRAQARRDVQEVRQSEIQQALQSVEKSIQDAFEESLKEKEKEWEKEKKDMEKAIKEELESLRNELEQELQEKLKHEDSDGDEEPPSKRMHLDESSDADEQLKDGARLVEGALEETKSDKPEKEDVTSKLSYSKKQEVEALQKKADDLVSLKSDMLWLILQQFKILKNKAKVPKS